jgi:hypothetical protein
VSTTISTDLTPLIDELPTTPVAVPTLWTLVATVGREYERTTLVESPTVNPLAGQITNGLLTDTSTLTGPSTDPVSTGTIGTPTPGLSDLTPTAQLNAALNAAAAEDPWTGEPSFVHEIFVGVFRVAGVVGRLFGAQSATSFLAPVLTSDSPPWFTTLGLDVQRSEFEGMPVWTVQSPGSTSGKTVVAIHGGGYVYQPSIFHWLDYAAMARDTGATVVVPIYPLAPQGTAATVVPQTADLISCDLPSPLPGDYVLPRTAASVVEKDDAFEATWDIGDLRPGERSRRRSLTILPGPGAPERDRSARSRERQCVRRLGRRRVGAGRRAGVGAPRRTHTLADGAHFSLAGRHAQ